MDMLRCLLLPVQDRTLIVPYAAITEVIEFSEPIPEENAALENVPAWFLGKIEWRGLKIPLMSLDGMLHEIINENEDKVGNKSNVSNKDNQSNAGNEDNKGSYIFKREKNMRIAILNRIKQQYRFEFLGVILQGIPRMSRVRKADLKDQNKVDAPFLMSANLRDAMVYIPDLELIEDKVEKFV